MYNVYETLTKMLKSKGLYYIPTDFAITQILSPMLCMGEIEGLDLDKNAI